MHKGPCMSIQSIAKTQASYMKIAQTTPVNDEAEMKVIIAWAWWRMLTAESMERKPKTGWDWNDCGRLGGEFRAYWDALSITEYDGRWRLQSRMWNETSLLFCWLRRDRKQRCVNPVITLTLKMSLSNRRDSTLKRSPGESSRLPTTRADRGGHTACWAWFVHPMQNKEKTLGRAFLNWPLI